MWIICRTYLDSLAEEVNDKLQQHGLVTIAELTKAYGLPGDFISQVWPYKMLLSVAYLTSSLPGFFMCDIICKNVFDFCYMVMSLDVCMAVLLQVIHARLGTIIKAQADDGDRSVLYTAQFVSQHRARIRGAFSAVTR